MKKNFMSRRVLVKVEELLMRELLTVLNGKEVFVSLNKNKGG